MKNFALKVLSAALISATLLYYQSAALERERIVEENNASIAEVEEYNRAILEKQSESPYRDGDFTGAAQGFGGAVRVTVSIENGRITHVTVTEHSGEDPVYFSQAETITEGVVNNQSWQIDAVSGATFTSQGILNAVEDAMRGAVK